MFPRALRFFLIANLFIWAAVVWHPIFIGIVIAAVAWVVYAIVKLPDAMADRAKRKQQQAYWDPRRFQ